MAQLPTESSLTSATTTNAQQKTNFAALRTFLADFLGTDSSNKAAARTALGVPGLTDFPASLATNGYYKLPGGLIIQWGEAASASNGAVSVAFPTAMPNGVAHFALTPRANNFNVYSVNKVGHSTAGFDAYCAFNGAGTAIGFDWIVIGF